MKPTLELVVGRLKAEEAALRQPGIRHLSLFGSVARGDERPDSDIDIAIEIEPGRRFSLIKMEEARLYPEDTLGRSVDLGEMESFRTKVRDAFRRDHVEVF